MLSRWVNSVTGKRELSAQISRLRPTRILDNAGMVNMDQLRELTKQSQLLASEMQNVDKEVGAASRSGRRCCRRCSTRSTRRTSTSARWV